MQKKIYLVLAAEAPPKLFCTWSGACEVSVTVPPNIVEGRLAYILYK
jgi:hypothetical protein